MSTLLFGVLAFAQTLSFTEALERAPRTPVVASARASHDRRSAEAKGMHRLTENPMIGVQPGFRNIHGLPRDTGPEVYVMATQRVRLTEQGKKRIASVQSELENDAAVGGAALRAVRLNIAQAWFARWAAQQVAEIAKGEVTLAHELLERMQATAAAGEATRVDVAQIQAWEAEASLLALQMEGMQFETGVELARVIGEAYTEPLATTEELPEIAPPSQSELRDSLGHLELTPSVVAARSSRNMNEKRLHEARAMRGTELNFGIMGWREGGGDTAGVGIIEWTIPAFERGKRESSAAAAALAQAHEVERGAVLDAHAERLRLMHEVVHREEVLRATEDSMLRAAENLEDAQRKRLEAREGTSLDWVLARRQVLRARIEAVNARAQSVLARFRAQEMLAPLADAMRTR